MHALLEYACSVHLHIILYISCIYPRPSNNGILNYKGCIITIYFKLYTWYIIGTSFPFFVPSRGRMVVGGQIIGHGNK